LRRDEALRWSRVAELAIDRNETPVSARIARLTKFGGLLQLQIEDMTAIRKPPGRRGCRELKIQDLHLHDLRHEGTNRLSERQASPSNKLPW
jgi:hypothetical protein